MKRTAGKKEKGHKSRGFDKVTKTTTERGTVYQGSMPTKKALQYRSSYQDMFEWEDNQLGGRYEPKQWMNFLFGIKREGIKNPVEFDTVYDTRFREVPGISNGNHRVVAANVLGIKRIPYTLLVRPGAKPSYHPRLAPYGPLYPQKRKKR